MMYDELVKVLREEAEWAEANEWETPIMLSDNLKQAADAIEDLISALKASNEVIAKNKPRWIPVTERLPEAERKSYLACTDTGYQCECRWTNNRFGIRESDKWGWSIFDIPQYQKVVAWMPLPKPYEPPKEET